VVKLYALAFIRLPRQKRIDDRHTKIAPLYSIDIYHGIMLILFSRTDAQLCRVLTYTVRQATLSDIDKKHYNNMINGSYGELE